ncbi:hypothetical protein A2Z23_00660 [Candidatus Curtissbacteria bacterium RBG_16_39_7]|uniref:Methyltransferase type 11 domain-containing protein n=1 Tax=Candidatus Curtissbacteria bacterium RBG_16_39_7 TaxID=1797707 RepID=A0A1F5G3L8_9BACT|nr:MAG: hypothetical protein A2Z23_00660 [Candidatus Curtissbacteria bacterium RBG_16_39_7]
MNDLEIAKILACPNCKKKLKVVNDSAKCSQCKTTFSKIDGIWSLITLRNKNVATAAQGYDRLHREPWYKIPDGSYEILASIARGNKTLDIACGQGFIEELSPETVGLDFSFTSLKQARKKGAKHLVWAAAENLPFVDNAFDLSICAGSLEHFTNVQKAILEMARVSKIQVLTVHREFEFPFAPQIRILTTKLLGVKNQPIEKPLRWGELKEMLKKAKLHVIFKGFWTLPVNFGQVLKVLPVFENIPSSFFVITTKR